MYPLCKRMKQEINNKDIWKIIKYVQGKYNTLLQDCKINNKTQLNVN